MDGLIDLSLLALYLKYFLLIFAAVVSVVSVVLCIIDKNRAKKHGRRIPEAELMLAGALGGALPMLITMLLIRHKTKHVKFMLGLPLEILLHGIIVFLICFNG